MSATEEFIAAQERLLQRVGVSAESRFLEAPAVSGRTHVLISGEGPPVVMVPGFGDPAAMWAPLTTSRVRLASLSRRFCASRAWSGKSDLNREAICLGAWRRRLG